jgi:PhnB protein
MAKLTPYLMSEDAKAQAEFYTQALGGEILSVVTYGQVPNTPEADKDRVIHLSMVAAGVSIFMTDSVPKTVGDGIYLSLEFASEDEAHEAFNNLGEGGHVKHPLEPAFWGALHGQVEDKYGITWMITTEAKAG